MLQPWRLLPLLLLLLVLPDRSSFASLPSLRPVASTPAVLAAARLWAALEAPGGRQGGDSGRAAWQGSATAPLLARALARPWRPLARPRPPSPAPAASARTRGARLAPPLPPRGAAAPPGRRSSRQRMAAGESARRQLSRSAHLWRHSAQRRLLRPRGPQAASPAPQQRLLRLRLPAVHLLRRPACIFNATAQTFAKRYKLPVPRLLQPSDAWAPPAGQQVLNGDCRFLLDSECRVQQAGALCQASGPCTTASCQWHGNGPFLPSTCSPFPACLFRPAACVTTSTCAPPPPALPPNTFSVMSFGAAGNGVTDDSAAMAAAFAAACSLAASGTAAVMLLPAGFVFRLAAPAEWKGPCGTAAAATLTIQLDGTLRADANLSAFSGAQQQLRVSAVAGLRLQGSGTLDGQGAAWWAAYKAKQISSRPVILMINSCQNAAISGITLVNSPSQHLKLYRCSSVSVTGVTVSSPYNSPNTDALSISDSSSVQVRQCSLSSGDDNIAIVGNSHDIVVRNIVATSGHGISIGSLGSGGSQACVSNVDVADCQLASLQNGLRIKTYQGGNGAVWNVKYTNVTMSNVGNPIYINQFYCDSSTSASCSVQPSAVAVFNVSFSAIAGTFNSSRGIAFNCSDTVPCQQLELRSINLTPAGGSSVVNLFNNAYGTAANVASPVVSGASWTSTAITASESQAFSAQIAKCGLSSM